MMGDVESLAVDKWTSFVLRMRTLELFCRKHANGKANSEADSVMMFKIQ